jgi:hypothetical protein
VVNEAQDWIMAVNIPLHGEEVMSLPSMHLAQPERLSSDSFQLRIEAALAEYFRARPYLPPAMGQEFIKQLRSMIRLSLASRLNLPRECQAVEENQYNCQLDGENFQVRVAEKSLRIKKELPHEYVLELHAENLTGPIFARSNYFLHSKKISTPILGLELFWK